MSNDEDEPRIDPQILQNVQPDGKKPAESRIFDGPQSGIPEFSDDQCPQVLQSLGYPLLLTSVGRYASILMPSGAHARQELLVKVEDATVLPVPMGVVELGGQGLGS